MAKKQIVKALERGASDKRTQSSTKAAARALASEFKPSQIAAKLGITTQKWTAVKNKIQKGKLFNPDLRDLLRKVESKLSGRKTKEEIEFEKFLKDAGLTKKEFKKQQKEFEKRELEENKKGGLIGTPGGVAGDQVVKIKKEKKEKRVQYRGGRDGEEGKEGGVYYYKYHEDLKKDAPECKVVKTVGDYKQARAWWAEIGAGSAYFAISRIKATGKGNKDKYKYQVVDIRTNDERNRRKGKGSSASKAREEVERAQEIYNNYKGQE